MRKCLLLLVLLGALSATRSYAQTTTFAFQSGGVQANNSTITAGASQIVLYGFSVQVSGGSQTFTQFNLSCGSTSQTYFGNGTLYRSSSSTFSLASPGTAIGNVVFNSNSITLNNFSETISSTTNYYFLVADVVYTGGSTAYSVQVYANTANFAMDSGGSTSYPFYGTYQQYNINPGTGYPVIMTSLTGGLSSTSTSLTPSMSGQAVFGFGLTNNSGSSRTFSSIQVNSNLSNLSTFVSTVKLYSQTSGNTSYSAGLATLVSTGSISGAYVSFPSVTIAASTTLNYFIVISTNSSYSTVPGVMQFNFTDQQSTTAITQTSPGSATYNDFTVLGNTYTFNSTNLTVTDLTGGTQSGTITLGQTGVVLFGFSIATASGSITVSGFNINSTNSASTFFGNGKLYRNSTTTYPSGTPVQVGTVTFSGNYAQVTGLSETITTSGSNYFLVADNISTASSATIAFDFVNGQSSNAVTASSPSTSFNNISITGNTMTLPAPGFAVTGANSTSTNGITSGALTYGENNIVLFGFGVQSFGTTETITTFNITTNPSASTYFSNGRLYRSTTAVYPGGTPLYSFGAFGGGTNTSLTVSESIPSGTTYYYWLVGDFTGTSGSPTTFTASFASGQSQPAIIASSPSYLTYNTYNITGNAFTVGGIYDWVGSSSTSFTTAGNFRINGSTPGTAPGANDLVRIGSVAYQFPSNQPTISANTTIGGLTFGTMNTPTLTIGTTSAVTLTIGGAGGLNVVSGSSPTITAGFLGGAVNISSASAVSTISGALSSSASLTNSGSISIATGASVALTTGFSAATFTNSGSSSSLSEAGTGTLTVAGAATNAGTITQAGTGTLTFSSTLTNTGTITQSSTGAVSVTGAVANNSPGVMTLGSGTNTFSSTITNASGASMAFGNGTSNIAGNFSNAGTITDGTGTNNFNGSATFTNTGTMTLSGGSTSNIVATTFSNTSPGTFTASAGTVNFSLSGTQAVNNTNTTTPVTFNNVTFGGSGTKTLDASGTGKFAVGSTGVLSLSGSSTILAAGSGLLTFNSTSAGSAALAAIPSGTSITGTVNVQRFITGGSGKRGYRLLSSPVYGGTANSNNVYSINYIANSSYITGTTAGNGIDQSGNPTLYLFRENMAPSQASFTSGNFRGVGAFGSSGTSNISYTIDSDTGNPYNIPVGNGFLFFFRGDRSVTTIANETVSSYVPTSTTLTAVGTLNTGNITVKDWYTPTSGNLGYTSVTANSAIRGYNLVGNPYPSTINWEKFNRQSTIAQSSIYGTGFPAASTTATPIYIFNSTSKQYAVYTPHTTISSVADTTTTEFTTASYSSDGVVSNMISSGQGFFIVATSASQALTFRESAKVTAQASSTNLGKIFAVIPQTNATGNPAMRIKLIADSTNTDAVVLIFNSSYSTAYVNGEDYVDAGGDGATVSLSSMSSDNVALTVNKLPLPQQTVLISPLAVSATSSGNFKLKMDAIENLPAVYEIWLKDNLMKDSLDMRANSTYSFSIDNTNAATYGTGRFQLVIRQSTALSLHLLNFTAAKITGAVQSQLNWTVENESSYTTFNVQRSTDGQNFTSMGSLQSDGSGNYSFVDKSPVMGTDYYRLQLTDLNGNITYSQVITLQFSTLSNNALAGTLSVYPNPAHDMIKVNINAAGSSNAFSLTITNSTGGVVKQANPATPSSQYDVSAFSPGVYFIVMTDNGTSAVIAKSKFVKL